MKVIDLEPKQELLFKVGEAPVKLDLRRGLADIYGNEMLANRTYTFRRNSKAAVFTPYGATIEMEGNPLKSHVSKNCDYMTCYLSIHRDLEKQRGEQSQLLLPQQADTNSPDLTKTPICLICEPIDSRNSGKSTLSRILLNFATRRGWAPILVDLDPDQGHINLPGTIGALSIESPIDIENGFSLRSAMLMHFGNTSPSADSESRSGLYYKVLIENMARIVHSKLEQDKKSYHSGVIINTSSWSDSADYKLLVHACKVFKANMVLVMDDEVLQDDLQKDLDPISQVGQQQHQEQQPRVTVLNVPKPVEIYKSTAAESVDLRYIRIKEYFYGTQNEPYNPMTSEVKFSVLKRLIYRVGNPLMLPDSLMPLGSKTQDAQIKVSPYDCSAADLLHHILSISYCKLDDLVADPDCILRTNLMGFICITSVKAEGEIVSILTPQKLPNPMEHILLYSEIQYMDSLI